MHWALTWSVDVSKPVLWITSGPPEDYYNGCLNRVSRAVVRRLCTYEPNIMVFLLLRLLMFLMTNCNFDWKRNMFWILVCFSLLYDLSHQNNPRVRCDSSTNMEPASHWVRSRDPLYSKADVSVGTGTTESTIVTHWATQRLPSWKRMDCLVDGTAEVHSSEMTSYKDRASSSEMQYIL